MSFAIAGSVARDLARTYAAIDEQAQNLHTTREDYVRTTHKPMLHSFEITEENLALLATLPTEARRSKIKEIALHSIHNLIPSDEPIPAELQGLTEVTKNGHPISDDEFESALEEARLPYVAGNLAPELIDLEVGPVPVTYNTFPNVDRPEETRVAVQTVQAFNIRRYGCMGPKLRDFATKMGIVLCLGTLALTSYVASRHR